MIRHAGLIALRLGGRWLGVLIEGPSGSGKSDLALRALDAGFRLAADDRVVLWTSGGRLFGRAPEVLHGLIEARGLAVAPEVALPMAEVALVARCGEPERMPRSHSVDILGVSVPELTVRALDASAPAKLRRAMAMFDHDRKRRM